LVTGTVSGALDAASVFGGFFGTVANLGNQVHSAAWQKAHDDAFVKAVEELKPSFVQCPRCSTWVCGKSCWNDKRGLCKNCAPDLGVEMAAAQASKTVQEIWENAATAEEDKPMVKAEAWQQSVRATCPQCGKPLANNAKFCSECGTNIMDDTK
jgi:uncharacterized OB-fold protein